ncbi:MAG: sulfite exporter TauE/SafE family protein [Spirochaetes bacterium]|uniref:Sulfite exporter TauE/SafE family protein n=1 Tax=Candidatus Ornithospirochaeta stercoripullorum TaxID=2840899 RepID=A0A9D9DZW3_9SPIO|nr:sulfite exporter TauE/SafE family protein [Candidatus Ornithospirochaeta stercoripullorum]
MLDNTLNALSESIASSGWLSPVIALVAGLITSITPCALSQIPLVLGYVGKEASPGKAFRLSLVYALGTAVTFTAFGIAASLMGTLIGNASRWWYLFLGILMILMALQMWEIINLIPSTYLSAINRRRGYIGALAAGVLGGIFSSPCSTPVLVALLSIAATEGEVLRGGFLLLLYSIGCTALAVVLGSSPSLIRKLGTKKSFQRISKILNIVLGIIVLLIGLYMLYLAF